MPELVTGVCCPVAGNVNSDQQRETRIPPESLRMECGPTGTLVWTSSVRL